MNNTTQTGADATGNGNDALAGDAIRITDMNKWYGDFHVLKDINLTVQAGERIVICGPSGSGKSTMIRCINRLESHQKGSIIVDGTELNDDLKHIEQIRREVGMVFQHFNLFPHLTVLDNLHTGADLGAPKPPSAEAEQVRHEISGAGQDPRTGRRSIPASSPAVSSSAWRSPAQSVHEPEASCCSTSRPRRSIRR